MEQNTTTEQDTTRDEGWKDSFIVNLKAREPKETSVKLSYEDGEAFSASIFLKGRKIAEINRQDSSEEEFKALIQNL